MSSTIFVILYAYLHGKVLVLSPKATFSQTLKLAATAKVFGLSQRNSLVSPSDSINIFGCFIPYLEDAYSIVQDIPSSSTAREDLSA